MSDVSKEKAAHDLAIIYGLYFSLKHENDILTPNEFAVNYKHDYCVMLDLLKDS